MTSEREHGGPGGLRACELRACAAYADRLVDLSDGDLPEGERAVVQSHVHSCPGCRAELDRLNASLLRLRDRVLRVCEAAYERPPANSWQFRPALVLTAGGVVAACVIAVALWLLGPPPNTGQTAQTPNADDKTGSSAVRPGASIAAAAKLSDDDVLRHIALVEQQARLQASLDLTPDDPWFADQRAANEKLLAAFKEATATPLGAARP
ncbi:MAG: zf-HC2 domain-containing protein [Planctomycetia bacterium]|nr:zf-HC2 domain-containing protein [Planctomycetia bacterium]